MWLWQFWLSKTQINLAGTWASGSSAYLCMVLTVGTRSTVDFGTVSRCHSFSVAQTTAFPIELMAGFPAETVCQGLAITSNFGDGLAGC